MVQVPQYIPPHLRQWCYKGKGRWGKWVWSGSHDNLTRRRIVVNDFLQAMHSFASSSGTQPCTTVQPMCSAPQATHLTCLSSNESTSTGLGLQQNRGLHSKSSSVHNNYNAGACQCISYAGISSIPARRYNVDATLE